MCARRHPDGRLVEWLNHGNEGSWIPVSLRHWAHEFALLCSHVDGVRVRRWLHQVQQSLSHFSESERQDHRDSLEVWDSASVLIDKAVAN